MSCIEPIGLALVGATTTLAAADPASRTQEQTDQGKALYRSELQRNLATARAASAAAGTDPATFGPGVDRLATLLVGLVVGLLGGAAAMLGWTATTRRRRPRAAAGPAQPARPDARR